MSRGELRGLCRRGRLPGGMRGALFRAEAAELGGQDQGRHRARLRGLQQARGRRPVVQERGPHHRVRVLPGMSQEFCFSMHGQGGL